MRRHALQSLALAGMTATGVAVMVALYAIAGQPAAHERDMLDATFAPGLVVDSLRSGGVAERAGLQVGDQVELLDGHAVRSADDITRSLAERRSVALRLSRDHHRVMLNVTVRRS